MKTEADIDDRIRYLTGLATDGVKDLERAYVVLDCVLRSLKKLRDTDKMCTVDEMCLQQLISEGAYDE